MGFLEKNTNEVKLILTPYGKTKFLTKGFKDTFSYFSFSDDDIIYHLCVEPQGVLEITGNNPFPFFPKLSAISCWHQNKNFSNFGA